MKKFSVLFLLSGLNFVFMPGCFAGDFRVKLRTPSEKVLISRLLVASIRMPTPCLSDLCSAVPALVVRLAGRDFGNRRHVADVARQLLDELVACEEASAEARCNAQAALQEPYFSTLIQALVS